MIENPGLTRRAFGLLDEAYSTLSDIALGTPVASEGGSLASAALSDFPLEISETLLQHSTEQVETILREEKCGAPILPLAANTRSVVECCAKVVWLLKDDISPEKRECRALMLRDERWHREIQLITGKTCSARRLIAERKKIRRRLQREGRSLDACIRHNSKGKILPLKDACPGPTELSKLVFKKPDVYRALSGIIHGGYGMIRFFGWKSLGVSERGEEAMRVDKDYLSVFVPFASAHAIIEAYRSKFLFIGYGPPSWNPTILPLAERLNRLLSETPSIQGIGEGG